VIDARELTVKYKKDPTKWNDVETFLSLKSNPKYYQDPIVMAGYCKCDETVNYVKSVLERYEEYKLHITG
jgi:membrane-bound lytic murein transglycosylase F